jgi:hypothetical protein
MHGTSNTCTLFYPYVNVQNSYINKCMLFASVHLSSSSSLYSVVRFFRYGNTYA